MTGIRERLDAIQRRLRIYPQRADNIVLCSGCAQPGVKVVTEHTPAGLRAILGRTVCHAWCLPCWSGRATPDSKYAVWVWWLPTPTSEDTTWAVLDDATADDPPGCCGCGGLRGPAQYVVWGPDDGPEGFESYCAPCWTGLHWDDVTGGCTWADLGPQYKVGAERCAAVATFPSRRPFPVGAVS